MPDLTFAVSAIAAVPFAASPMASIELHIRNATPGEEVRALALTCQVRIEPQRRRYTPAEQVALAELFGEPGSWERTLHPLLWTHAAVAVPPFTGEVTARLSLPFTYDLGVASARYFHALADGEAPLILLFSGTVFHARADGALQAVQVPWSKEARCGLPARLWRETMDAYYPGTAGVMLRRDVFDRLHRHRARRGFSTLDQALESLLPPDDAEAR